jgi:hypothetical protein
MKARMLGLLALGLLAGLPAAHASAITLEFTGTCTSGCSGSGTAQLTLADSYVYGSSLAAADFIALSYLSSGQSWALDGSESGFNVAGCFLASGGLCADFSVTGGIGLLNDRFEVGINGVWSADSYNGNAVGENGSFFPKKLPEPGTLALLGLGLGGLLLARRRGGS